MASSLQPAFPGRVTLAQHMMPSNEVVRIPRRACAVLKGCRCPEKMPENPDRPKPKADKPNIKQDKGDLLLLRCTIRIYAREPLQLLFKQSLEGVFSETHIGDAAHLYSK